MPGYSLVNAWFARFLWTWAPALLWFLVIYGFSSASEPHSTAASRSLLAWLLGPWATHPEILRPAQVLARKGAHILEFSILATLLWRALGLRRWRLVLALCLVAAACDEWHQLYVPGRGASATDLLIDLVGPLSCRLLWPRAGETLRRALLWGTVHQLRQCER